MFSTFTAWACVEFLSRYLVARHHVGPSVSIVVHAMAFGLLIVTATVIVGAVVAAFRKGDRKALLITVLVSYFSLMLMFASVYYEAAFFGDFQDAVFKYDVYRAMAMHHIEPGEVYQGRRAFYGIERRFWTGVDWPRSREVFVDGLPAVLYHETVADMQHIAATTAIDDTVQFIPGARAAIFADCLHLSVVTMTTVGYGDITPRSLPARVASDAEAVCNTLLLIFGLGMIFGNWRSQAA